MIRTNLTIENIAELKELFLASLGHRNSPVLDFSGVERIDLAGLQLLVSTLLEAKRRDREVRLTGNLCPDFRQDLGAGCFFSHVPTDGEGLATCLNRLIEK